MPVPPRRDVSPTSTPGGDDRFALMGVGHVGTSLPERVPTCGHDTNVVRTLAVEGVSGG
jgi:hypothetical protein